MPDDELAVADTSPLLNLALIGRLDLSTAQFPRVVAPDQVWDELTAGEDGLDEREGRIVARRHGLAVTGVIGILLRGESRGTVDLGAELDALREEGFWISDDLHAAVLEASEESPD